MTPYLNQSGSSGISHYRIGKDFIEVRFTSAPKLTYIYNELMNGQHHINTMKKLAVSGKGLSTYIAVHTEIRDHFTTR